MGGFNRNFRRSGRNRFDRRGSGRFNKRDKDRDRPSEMHPAVCDKCGKECEVPFRPTEGKPIYCDDCFKEKSREAGSRSGFGKPYNENLDNINKKLDRILNILEGKVHAEKRPEVKESKSIEKKFPSSEKPKITEKKKPKKKAKKS